MSAKQVKNKLAAAAKRQSLATRNDPLEKKSLDEIEQLTEWADAHREDRIRELYKAMHAAVTEDEKSRIWAELGEYILRSADGEWRR